MKQEPTETVSRPWQESPPFRARSGSQQQTLRLERAEHLLSHGATSETAAREAGFEDPRMLRRLRSRTR